MMDPQPRRLPVFLPVEETPLPRDEEGLTSSSGSIIFQARDASSGHFTPLAQLGYEGGAVAIKKGRSISFDLPDSLFAARPSVSVVWPPVSSVGGPVRSDSLFVEVRLLPNHAIEGDSLRFRLSFDRHATAPVNYETYGRSEEWKQNVLRNQARRRFRFPLSNTRKRHRLTLQAMDEGIVLDQIVINPY